MVKTKLPNEEFKNGNELTDEEIKILVDKYVKLKSTVDVLLKEMEKVKGKLVDYSRMKEVSRLDGTNRSLNVVVQESYLFPQKGKDKKLMMYLKKYDYWEIFSEIDKPKLMNAMKEKKFTPGVMMELEEFVKPRKIYKLIFDRPKNKVASTGSGAVSWRVDADEKKKKGKLYRASHGVFGGGYMFCLKVRSGNVMNKGMIKKIIDEMAASNKFYEWKGFPEDKFVVLFFAAGSGFVPVKFIDGLRERIADYGDWNEEEVFGNVEDIEDETVDGFMEELRGG